MHNTDFNLTLSEITKVEGAASLNLQIREGKVTKCQFAISEMKRFFTTAIRGKPIAGVPQLVARICGTCSNAHLLCSLKSIEHGLKIKISPQTLLLRKLLNYGLIIRDHGLHLYIFVLPDVFNRDSILAFDEKIPAQHRLLHDCFAVKETGNQLGIIAGGRSVHAPFLTLGGFIKLPEKNALLTLIPQLEEIRPRILHLIDVFLNCDFTLTQEVQFLALCDKEYSFLNGFIKTSGNIRFSDEEFSARIQRVDIPYSQATGYMFGNQLHMVGALARINLNKDSLHQRTRGDTIGALAKFPSHNIFHNNLAQAIEMLHAVDSSIDLIHKYSALPEKPEEITPCESTGIGIIEAPRGTLFHKMEMTAIGKINKGTIIVPTGQNQIGIEHAISDYVSLHINQPKDELAHEIEKIIRAYDPCMSCASHFLKIKWS